MNNRAEDCIAPGSGVTYDVFKIPGQLLDQGQRIKIKMQYEVTVRSWGCPAFWTKVIMRSCSVVQAGQTDPEAGEDTQENEDAFYVIEYMRRSASSTEDWQDSFKYRIVF